MTINTQKLREALELIECELQASYNNAKPVCCGHGYGECCGNPEPVWDAADQKIMYVLGPIQQMLFDAVSQADAQTAEIARLREALGSIRQYGNDTLSGRADGGPDDRKWQREAVIEMRNRARAALQEKSNG